MPPSLSERQRLEHELAQLLDQLGALRDEMESPQPGPTMRFRWRRLLREAESLEHRLVGLRARWATLPVDRI